MKKAMHIVGEILAAICVLLAVAGCQTGPKPGEATITGGKAEAARFEDGGWAVRSLPDAPKPVEPKPAPTPDKWIIILHPLPEDAASPAEAQTVPAPVEEPK